MCAAGVIAPSLLTAASKAGRPASLGSVARRGGSLGRAAARRTIIGFFANNDGGHAAGKSGQGGGERSPAHRRRVRGTVARNGHRDSVHAARNRMLKLRYICRLFAKEPVLKNFIGIPQEQLLERLLELALYTAGNLR